MSQPNRYLNDEKSKQQTPSKYRYTTTNYYFLKHTLTMLVLVLKMRIKSLTMFSIPVGLP
ncbi:hypothetical protein H5410_002410 [Solanum commersonii]|uniref:Uncharacterized protein n=1 Tax=Solanum commersonii TaxID=4109 RepID=A0A9J6B1P3_SOLCO|nr:hypothetical protein H5410_002410 [Solanum commersonii]